MEVVKTSIHMSVDIHKRLKSIALERGLTLGEAIEEAVRVWMDNGGNALAPIVTQADAGTPYGAQGLYAAKLQYILEHGALNQATGIQLALDTFESLIRERERRGRVVQAG